MKMRKQTIEDDLFTLPEQNLISDMIFELFKRNDIHRVKIEIGFTNGVNISQENIRPNKLKEKK